MSLDINFDLVNEPKRRVIPKICLKKLLNDLKVTLEVKIDLWSRKYLFHVIPWPQNYRKVLSFIIPTLVIFWKKIIILLSYFDPVGQKWPFRSPKENRWLFCILLPPKKYYKPYFPGGSLRITDQYIWKKLIFATNNHKSPKNRQEGTKIF